MLKQFIPLQTYNAAYLDTGFANKIDQSKIDQRTPRTLVFLHGFLGESRAWLPLIKELEGDYRCIALDLLGFGDSAKPKLKYTIWHQVEFLQEFLSAIEIDNFCLVGHSYGGWTAAAFALKYPTQALALIAPAGIRDDSFVGRYNYLKPLLWENAIVDLVLKAISPLATLIRKSQEFQVIAEARKALINQPVARSFIYDRIRPEDAIDTLEEDIHTLAVPTLVIAGDEDDTIPLWHCQVYADRIQNAEIKILARATHALIQTHSQEIAKLILNTTIY